MRLRPNKSDSDSSITYNGVYAFIESVVSSCWIFRSEVESSKYLNRLVITCDEANHEPIGKCSALWDNTISDLIFQLIMYFKSLSENLYNMVYKNILYYTTDKIDTKLISIRLILYTTNKIDTKLVTIELILANDGVVSKLLNLIIVINLIILLICK